MKRITMVNAVSAGTTQASPIVTIGDLRDYAMHVDFSGSDLAGTLKLQASLDGTDWVDVASSSQAITSAASHIWNVSNAAYEFVRAHWTYSSGTGNWTVLAVIKESFIKGV